MEGKAAVLLSMSFMLGIFDLSWAIINGFSVPAVFNTDPIHPRICGRFPEGEEELLHAIENAFDNLNAVGIPDVDLIDPHGDFSFSLWGVTSRFEFDRSWSQNEQGNHGNQTDWLQPPTIPGGDIQAINHCVRIGTKHGEQFIKSNFEHHELCASASPICWEASTQWGTPYLTDVTGPEGGAERACNKLGGQGVFEVKNNADMYRLWRHIYQSRRFTDHFWVHGFRTNAHSGDRISLDHYDEHGHNCGMFFSARGNQFTGGQVVSVPCDRPNVNYICDDVHYIRYINYYHPTNDKY